MNANARTSLDSTFAVAVLVAGLVFGVLPATANRAVTEQQAAPQTTQVSQTADGRTKVTVTASREA